jgi:hypothetical protein
MTAINNITFSFFMIFSFEIEIVSVLRMEPSARRAPVFDRISKCAEREFVEERLFLHDH